MSLVEDIAAVLVTYNVGHLVANSTDWQIYYEYLQDAPDRAICLYETPGEPPEEAWAIDRPSLQVRVRGKENDAQAVRERIRLVFLCLQDQAALIGANYTFCFAKGGVMGLGQDEKRRPHFVQNYRLMVKRDQTN